MPSLVPLGYGTIGVCPVAGGLHDPQVRDAPAFVLPTGCFEMLPGDRSGGVEIDIRGALKSTCTRRSPAVSKVDVGEDLDHRDRSVGTLPVEAQSGGQTLRFDRCSRVRGRELLGMAIPPTSLAAKPSGRSRSTVHRNVRIRATPSSSRHDAPHLVYVRSGEIGMQLTRFGDGLGFGHVSLLESPCLFSQTV